jgi:hypothetical protein
MENTRRLIPAARREELVIHEVEGETLVYDLKSHKAHCLNPTAALVWKHCDGKRTVEQVALRLERELQTSVSAEVVWMALDQLEKLRLLEAPVERAPGMARMSRRELARRLGVATAIALPFIASINAPAAIQAASCAGVEEPCGGTNPPCCSGFVCFNNSCINP